ncbi:MAG: hypothetical protein NTU69_10965 [Proteobacteria bacterium]|nr:hypothetical protein [Pseudomonadota bacterium]
MIIKTGFKDSRGSRIQGILKHLNHRLLDFLPFFKMVTRKDSLLLVIE